MKRLFKGEAYRLTGYGINCNHIASHTGREIFLTLFSTNILSLTGQGTPITYHRSSTSYTDAGMGGRFRP
ncbi:MAG: hypothetical protein LBJ00_13465 [Planctomycetaceae bacterium]|nr:hypothetical protein [Planctomycetaceae bacterium]